jgi:hypothetical protein
MNYSFYESAIDEDIAFIMESGISDEDKEKSVKWLEKETEIVADINETLKLVKSNIKDQKKIDAKKNLSKAKILVGKYKDHLKQIPDKFPPETARIAFLRIIQGIAGFCGIVGIIAGLESSISIVVAALVVKLQRKIKNLKDEWTGFQNLTKISGRGPISQKYYKSARESIDDFEKIIDQMNSAIKNIN